MPWPHWSKKSIDEDEVEDVDRAGMAPLTSEHTIEAKSVTIHMDLASPVGGPVGIVTSGEYAGTMVGMDKDGRAVPMTSTTPAPRPGVAVESGFGPPWDLIEADPDAMRKAFGVWPSDREPERHVGLPVGGVELDLHYLVTFVQGTRTTFGMGAMDRLRGKAMYEDVDIQEDSKELYVSGYLWADRLVEARKLMAYIEEGEP